MTLPKVGGSITWDQAVDPDLLGRLESLGDTPGRVLSWSVHPATGPDWRPIQAILQADGDGGLNYANAEYLEAAIRLCVESVTDSDDGMTHTVDDEAAAEIAASYPNHITAGLGELLYNLNVAGIAATGKDVRSARSAKATRITGTPAE